MVTRAELESARAEVGEAEQQIGTSRAEIERAQRQIQETRSQLKPKKRVPFTPRRTRELTKRFKRELGATEEQLRKQREELAEYESQLQKYKGEVLSLAEQEIARVEQYNAAVDIINRAASRGDVYLHAIYGRGVVRDLAKKYLKQEEEQRQALEKQVAQYELENPTEKLQVDWDKLKVTGVTSGALGQSLDIGEYNKRISEISGDIVTYDKPLQAYYDPIRGKEVLQSIAPSIAKKQGLLPISIKGFSPSTGKYLVESKTGLLTPSQQAFQELYSKVQRVPVGETPSTFEIGGIGEDVDPLQIMQKPRTPYEAALRQRPYAQTEQEKIDYQRLGAKGFKEKYGYEITPKGERLYPGGVVPVTPEDIIGIFPIARAAQIGRYGVAAGITFSEPISRFTSETIEKLIPRQDTGFAITGAPAQIGRGALFYAMGSNPVVAPAYLKTILKSAAEDPVGTAKELWEYSKGNPYELATIGLLGKAEIRVRQRIARSKMYYEIIDKLEVQYGTKSKEVIDFKKAWARAFKELPKRSDVIRKWSSKDLEAVKGDKRLIKILDELNSKYKPEVIGTTTIMPQTTLKELPRGKAGDIDVQNVPGLLRSKSREMARETYSKLRQAGYNVRLTEGTFFGNPKYYITIFDDAKGRYVELINIGTDTGYFLNTQLAPLRDLFEFKRIGQFVTDPVTGVRLSGIRGQLRVKLAKGYGEGSTARIRQLQKLAKEGKLVGREKDILDALGILEGTNYLFKGKEYIGTTSPIRTRDIAYGLGLGVGDIVRGSVGKVNELLTGKKTPTGDYGYYDLIPTKRRKAYEAPSKYYKKKPYNPGDYLIPQYKAPYKKKPSKYKEPYSISNYLVPKAPKPYKPGKPPKYKPPYNPGKYLIPGAPPYKPGKPPYAPPIKTTPALENFLIPIKEKKKKKKASKKKRKKPKYKTLPTLTQQIIGYKGKKAVERVTGFESIRII